MKNTICGFDQDAVLDLRKVVNEDGHIKTIKPDCTDLEILSWIVWRSPMNSTEFGVPASYGALRREMPAIDITNNTFYSKLKKMVRLGLLIKTEGDPGRSESFYIPGEKYRRLLAD